MFRKISVTALIALISALVVAAVTLVDRTWRPFENRIYDLKYQFRYPVNDTLPVPRINEQIVIVDIDEASLAELGRYQNWPRIYFAEAIRYLAGAAAVGVDVYFGEPDTLPLACRLYYHKPNFDSAMTAVLLAQPNIVLVSSLNQLPIYHGLAHIGLGEVVPDDDGVVRTGFRVFGPETTFAAKIASLVRPAWSGPDRFRILYMKKGSFRRIPFADVYFQRVPREYFNQKIVLIGGTARGLFDYRSVPFSRYFPGVEIHANLVNSFINSLKITEIPFLFIVWLSFLSTFLIALMVIFFKPRVYLLLTLIIYLLLLVASFMLFNLNQAVELGVIRPYYTMTFGLISVLIYRYRIEEKEKRRIRSIFSRYYSRELLDKVLAAPPVLGGERVIGTVIFADIRNFTPFVEKTTPEQVAEKLNRHLTEMVEIVFFYQGRVDKYIGDCVMAVFGTPVKVNNHALNACRAARDMVKMAAECGFKIGVGINSGVMISGNFGSPMRMEYTVVGDNVNLAARLETATKELGVGIVASEATVQMAMRDHPADFSFRPLGAVRVKGKEEEIKVYEVA